MTTSPEALREAEPVKCLGERFQDAFLRGWGDDRLVAYADLPAESQAKWNRAALAFVCTLSDAPTELQSALQEAREADVRVAAFLIEQQDEPSFWDTTNPGLHARVNYWRNKCIEAGRQLDPKRWGPTDPAEVYRALSPGGARDE